MSVKCLLRMSCAVSGLLIASTAAAQVSDERAERPAEASTQTTQEDSETPDEAPRSGVEEREITVTGSRFSKLLDQPQPKAVISAEDRNLAGVNSASELIRSQPGFNITGDFGINVRGVGRQTAQTLLGQENTVIQYIDNFINLVPEDIAESTLFGGNITFVRGPAGTTYGRNAIAGAINVISRAPTKDFTAQVVAGTARAGAYNFGANLSGPITDNLGFRVGMQRFVQPSIFKAVGGAKGAGFAIDNTYFEFQLDWNIGNLHVRNRATTFSYDNQPGYPTVSRYNNGLNGNTSAAFGDLSPNPAFGYDGPLPNQPYQTNVNVVGYDRLRGNFQNVLNADLDLGFATFFYTGGYQEYVSSGEADRDLTSRVSYDGDTIAPGTFEPGTQVPTDYRTNYLNDNYFWSQEVRLEGNGNGPLDWVLGFYYFNQKFDEQYWENIANATDAILNPIVGTPGLTLAPNPRRSTYEQRNLYEIRSNAVFGNVTWDITPEIRFDGGLRYTMDEKEAQTDFRLIYYYPPLYAGDFSPLVHSANPERRDKGLSGRAAIAWRPGPGDQIYASYARGYQSSAFTLGQGLPPDNIADKEYLDVFEIGGNWTSGRLRFDGSIFYQIFHDQQIPIRTRGTFVGPDGPVLGPVFTTFANAKKTEIYGAEAQLSWRPNDFSNVVASYTYLHPTFTDFCPQAPGSSTCGVVNIAVPEFLDSPTNLVPNPDYGPLDLTGNELPRAPRHKASLYGYYGIDMGAAGRLYPGGSIYYQSSFYTSPFTLPNFRVPGRALVNATLTYRTADERLDITAVVSNLFRKRYADSSVLATFGSGSVQQNVYYGADRHWSLTARYRF
ncbi:TonB-dependent receptor [Sphingopyxis granuli]|uniref:TonB-dependent receptor n=1 Tax=Sphingopyxis granuli TaxID=267128 RepID=UPI0009EDFCA9|nr:TonB-dependent receptor [Sphingopyxis granuli]